MVAGGELGPNASTADGLGPSSSLRLQLLAMLCPPVWVVGWRSDADVACAGRVTVGFGPRAWCSRKGTGEFERPRNRRTIDGRCAILASSSCLCWPKARRRGGRDDLRSWRHSSNRPVWTTHFVRRLSNVCDGPSSFSTGRDRRRSMSPHFMQRRQRSEKMEAQL